MESGQASRRNERGVVAVEFALLLPVLMLILFGIIEFSRGYNARITVTNAAREGARALALGDDPVAAAQAASGALDPGSMTVSSSGSPCQYKEPVTVTVSYPVTFNIPFLPSGTWTVSETGSMRCEVKS